MQQKQKQQQQQQQQQQQPTKHNEPQQQHRLSTKRGLRVVSRAELPYILRVAMWHAHDLRELRLHGDDGPTPIDDALLQVVGQACPQLRVFKLRHNHTVTDDGLVHVATSCTHLGIVTLESCLGITNAGVRQLAVAVADSLQRFTVKYCPHVSAAGLCHVLDRCMHLDKLRILAAPVGQAAPLMTTLVAQMLAKHKPPLQMFDFEDFGTLTVAGYEMLARACVAVRRLRIWAPSGMCTSEVVRYFASHCPLLQQLRLQYAYAVDDAALVALAVHCGDLRHLALAHSRLVTDEGLLQLVRTCTSLTYVELCGCEALSADIASKLRAVRPVGIAGSQIAVLYEQ